MCAGSSFAAVVIPTLCRFEHLKNCVESLLESPPAAQTDLLLYIDFPPTDAYRAGHEQICRWAEGISGFNKVTVIRHEHNLGALGNCRYAVEHALKSYSRIIFTEDDNVFSPSFLEFMNRCLEKYEDDPRIHSVCGYNFPFEDCALPDGVYLSRCYSAWGCGFWRGRANRIGEYSRREMLDFFSNPRWFFRLYRESPRNAFGLLMRYRRGGRFYGDMVRGPENIRNNTFCLFPVVSRVRNCGQDGSGAHCGKKENDIFSRQPIASGDSCNMDVASPYPADACRKWVRRYFRISPRETIIMLMLYVWYVCIRRKP